MTPERDRLRERRELVTRDLEELAVQVRDGEVDEATADHLRSTYQAELESLDLALGELPSEEALPEQVELEPRAESHRPRSPRRMIIGSLIIIALSSAAIAFAARDASPPQAPVSSGAPGDLIVDPASVSNEQLEAIVAENPSIIGMRMALADRYFEDEEYSAALDHYLFIAQNAPIQADESKALARVGWMAYVTNMPDAAEEYVQASLRVDPANPEAVLYLGFITFYGLGDAEAAIPQLEAALELPNISDNVVSQIEAALVEARQGTTAP